MRASLGLLLVGGCITELPDLEDPCASWPDPGTFKVKIETDDAGKRKPHVYVPASEGPRDVLVLLHGGGQNGEKIAESTEFEALADREGFVVVFPNGTGWPIRNWNAGPQWDEDTDDVGFLDQLVKDVMPKVCGARVWAAGFSNGGMMAQRWACQSDTVEGIAVAAGPLMVDGCDGPPVPFRYYHGTADDVVPIEGGRRNFLGAERDFPPMEQTIEAWRERNLCDDTVPEATTTGDTTCTRWQCEAPVEQCVIEGFAHAWPGGIHSPQTDADATGEVWAFFQAWAEQQGI